MPAVRAGARHGDQPDQAGQSGHKGQPASDEGNDDLRSCNGKKPWLTSLNPTCPLPPPPAATGPAPIPVTPAPDPHPVPKPQRNQRQPLSRALFRYRYRFRSPRLSRTPRLCQPLARSRSRVASCSPRLATPCSVGIAYGGSGPLERPRRHSKPLARSSAARPSSAGVSTSL